MVCALLPLFAIALMAGRELIAQNQFAIARFTASAFLLECANALRDMQGLVVLCSPALKLVLSLTAIALTKAIAFVMVVGVESIAE